MNEQDFIKKQLEALRAAKKTKNSNLCNQIISVISEYFDVPKSINETKYAIELLFKDSDKKIDFLKFIITAILAKALNDSAIKIFEVIQKVTLLYTDYVSPYSKNIAEVSVQCLKCSEPSSRFKEMAVQTVAELIENELLDDEVDMEMIISNLMAVFNQDMKVKLFSSVFMLLGKISKKYPQKFTQQTAIDLRNRMITTIQNLFKGDKATSTLTLVAGTIKGLENHLINFSPKEDDEEFMSKLYECMLQLSNKKKHATFYNNTNRVAFRNMLEIIHSYGHLVSDKLFDDCMKWHNVLLDWLRSSDNQDRNAGIHATYTFHVEVAANLEKRKNDDDKPILLFFMNYFQKTLERPQSEPHEIRIAIRGFGLMAVACKILLEPKYLYERFDLIVQRTEYSYDVNNKMERREVLEHLPSYVEALSKIMNQLDEISGIQLNSLQSVLVVLIKDFHFLPTSHHPMVANGILETFLNLQKSGGKILDDIVEAVVWQGILWTCSHQLTYDLHEQIDNIKDWKETITYQRYLPLWKRILTPQDEKHKLISSKIYEHFIKNLFLIIDKLDLSTKKRKYQDESTETEVEFYFTDPSLDLEPVRAENFQILYNLVQFYQDILTQQTEEQLENYFLEWIELWIEKSIQLSYKHSIISAFMYFVEIGLTIIDRVNYTHDSSDIVNKFKTIETLKSYIRTLFPRCQQVSGELQVACLQLIFKAPTFILIDHINEMTDILITGFMVGKSVLSLAHYALTCFENLIQVLIEDPKTRRNLMEQVLPCLETFLSTSKESTVESELRVLKYRKRKNKAIIQNVETDLMRIKKRIMLFIGNCSPDESQLVLNNFEQKLIKDYITDIFQVKLECDDQSTPLIYLDQIIERVCHLSLYSSDRSTKVSACELLHGLVLYMMGKNLDRSESLPMWRNLCKNIIILGADKDQTVRQLFEPLLMQMMHYFSQPNKILSPLSTVLMESVMEMMSCKENGIQDLSARLLREYILWLMRQTDREQRKISPVRLVDFFYELRKMSIDADQSRRLAATLGFNNIYKIVREEESLIDVYWLYLLDIFCMNFKSTEDFSEKLDVYFVDSRRFEQISASLDHLTRVFVEKYKIFNQINLNRIIPKGFQGMTLKHVLNWLFIQCASPQYFYRHKCMEIFAKILTAYNTKEVYYSENWNIDKIINIGDVSTGIAEHPDLNYLSSTQEPVYKETFLWLKKLLSAIEFYHWILKSELIPADEISDFMSKTVIINSIEFFLNNIALNDMVNLLRSINENLLNSTQASLEIKMKNQNLEKVDVMRSLIIINILDFLTVLMQRHQIDSVLLNNKDSLFKLIKRLIFKPQRLNFDYKSLNIVQNYEGRLVKFIKTCTQYSDSFGPAVSTELQKKTMKYFNDFCQQSEKILASRNTQEIDESKLKGLTLLLTELIDQLDTSELSHNLIVKSAELLLTKIFNGVVEEVNHQKVARHFTPSMKKFATKMIRMCLKINPFLLKIATYSFDSLELKVSESCTIHKGEHFLQTFKNPIFEVFTTMIQDAVELLVAQLSNTTDENRLRIFNILAEMNEFIYTHHSQNVKLLESNFDVITRSWPIISETFMKMNNNLNCVDLTIINLVTYVAMTCPHELITIGQRLPNFKRWLLDLFLNNSYSLEVKSKGIFLLPCITNSDDKSNDELMRSLNAIQQKHIPLRSTEFAEGSIERSSLVSFSNAIYQALLTSKSPVIYRFLLNITVIDEKYILEEKLQKVQIQLMNSMTEMEQEVFLTQTFETFMNENFDAEIRLSIMKRYMLTLLKNSYVDTILSFIKHKISQIFKLIDSKFDIDPENAFVNRSAGYMIIEAFSAGVPREKIEAATYSYNGNVYNGLALIKDLIMKAKDVRRDVVFMVEDSHLQELFRKFQCYCYRALATLVANTKDLPEVFNLCLFIENTRTGSYIWRKLINIRDENIYSNWTQDFDEFPKVKKYLISIKELEVNSTEVPQNKYINTISIFDKSLSQSLTKTDLSYAFILSKREILEKAEKEHQKTMQIGLESISINEHEIMGTLVGVINLMYSRKLSIFRDFDKADSKKYEWVISIANSLRNSDQHKNVKIFLCKLIENCRNVFCHYAQFLLGPILSVLTDGTFGDSLNFFITDLVTMLLSWSNVYKPIETLEKEDAAILLKFLMKNAYHERPEVFKLNLELIKKLIETWNEIFAGKLPTQILLDMLQRPIAENHSTMLICGIQINAVVLANNLTPWNNKEQSGLFIKEILSAFNDKNPKIYQAASQLMGLCLQIIAKNDENDINALELVKQKLEKLQNNREKSEIFLQLLYGIQKEFPTILDSFMSRIASSIPSAIRKTKCIYLEMFLARLDVFKDSIYKEIATINIRYLLTQKEYQLLALHIINKGIEFLSAEEFMKFFDDLSYLTTSTNDGVKNILYEIMIYSVEKYGTDEKFERHKPIKIILKGFFDTDEQIQKRVLKFFNEKSGLSKSFKNRFQELLSTYYDPNLEKIFLHYATIMLLEIPIHHPRSTRTLLDYDPGNNINYFEYPISTKISSQRSLPPMFIQSQQKQLLAGDGSQYNQWIRATQFNSNENLMFAPTQDPKTMTQVPQTFNFKQTQNSLFVSLKPQFLSRRSEMSSSLNEALDLQMEIQKNKEQKSDSLDYLRQRIVKKNTSEVSKQYAMRAIERRDFSEMSRNQRLNKLKQGKEVTLYRRYRLGDFPDFFFNSLAVLMPLQALVKKDDIIARHVFKSIFESIVNTFEETNDEDAKNEFYASINKSIVYAFENTTESSPLFLGTMIELASMSEKYLEISPKIIGNSLSITGILFLESQLMRMNENKNKILEDIQQSAKRIKIDEDEVQIMHWMKLIDLYYKLNEYEVVNGIFTEKLKLTSIVKIDVLKAVDFELSSQYKDAFDIYSNLISQNAYRNQSEKDFYYNSYFNCLTHLSDWKQITSTVQNQLDNYEEIWNGTAFNTNILLPILLKGELNKILNDMDMGFFDILENWLENDDRNEYLHRKFPEEIAMLYIVEENYAACSVDMDKIIQTFTDEWSTLEILDDKLKLLKSCRNIAEITNFVSIMTMSNKTYFEHQIDKMFKSWHTSNPKSTDSLILWNDLIAYRKMFLALLSEYGIADETRKIAEASIIDIKRNVLNIAFEQKNLDAANYLVSSLKNELAESSNVNKLKFNLAIGKYTKMNAEQKFAMNNIQFMKKLGRAWEKLKTGVLTQDCVKECPELEIDALICTSEISWKVFKLYEKVDEDALTDDINEGFKSILDAIDDECNVMEEMLKYGEAALKSARNIAQKYVDENYSPEKELIVGNTYFKLSQFYRNVFVEEINTSDELQIQLIKSIFRAISYGAEDASVYIPYVLQLPALKNNKITKDFNEQLNMVPEWMFLSYISQILSNFDFENDCHLDNLMIKLAKKYPNALYYPFNLSRDNFNYINDNQVMEKSLVKDIGKLLSNPTIDEFTSALQCLVVPEKFIEIHFKNFYHELGEIETNEKFQEAVQKLYDNVFVHNKHLKGHEFTKIADHEDKILGLKKFNYESDMDIISTNVETIYKVIEKSCKKHSKSIELRKLCRWLADYKWSGEINFIEIPGQYSGKVKPFVESHVKVVRFDQRVKVFNSKQLPIEMKIYGSDGKTYDFIIKHGEDLRQDQRIQQALKLMSEKLSHDKNCKQNKLKIDTYQVIPINSMCGILQIVNNATTILDFMLKISKQFMVQEFSDFIAGIRLEYRDFMRGDQLFQGWTKLYEHIVLNIHREELVAKFIACENKIPGEMLQRSLQNVSVTLEAYYILRKNFITSLAAMSIGHWLLGIGDRHLSNILIDMKSGRLIGIDFGIAFGTAAALTVPELIPFRLTSHFVKVLEPMSINGLIKKNMIHALNCFRNNKEALLIFLEVFVREPTLNWLLSSKLKSVGTSGGSTSSVWNPEKRIDIVKRKLDGANPTKILIEELSAGNVKSKKLFKAYKRLINGRDDSLRRKFENGTSGEILTVEDQITCLIELATDKAMLASTYIGWDPWF